MKILWIPHTNWQIPQRAHLFCRALSEKHEVHVTDWVADFSRATDYLSSKYLKNFLYSHSMDGNVHVHRIPRVSPALYFAALRKFNQRIYTRYIKKIIDVCKIEVVVSTSVVPPPSAKRLIFDVFDDNPAYWIYYRNNSNYANEINEIEKLYIQRADSIVTVSTVLYDKVIDQTNGLTKKVTIIPNGVNLAAYKKAQGNQIRKAYHIDQKHVIGFISSMGEFSGLLRLIDAYAQVSNNNTALLIVGGGPLIEPAKIVVDQLELKDVIFTGKVPSQSIADYFKALDIGMIPNDKNQFRDAACPIKLLEYTAAGNVVVSTNLEEVRRMGFPNVLLVEENASALAEGIQKGLNMPFTGPENLKDYDINNLVSRYEEVLVG